jgi:hypothetical protein
MARLATIDKSPFNGGEIITTSAVQSEGTRYFGHPAQFCIDIFLKTRKVETANKFLTDIEVPWRVSAINIVDGSPQWTIA